MDLWGNISENELYHYTPSTYKPYQAYTPYGEYQTLTEEMPDIKSLAQNILTGNLSPLEEQNLQRQFDIALPKIREGAYGMPIGAQKGLEMSAISDAILQSKINQQSMLIPLLSFMSGEKQYKYGQGLGEHRYGYETGLSENRYGQEFNQRERMTQAEIEAANKRLQAQSGFNLGNFLTGATGALTSFGLSRLFPLGGGNTGALSSSPSLTPSSSPSFTSSFINPYGNENYLNGAVGNITPMYNEALGYPSFNLNAFGVR